MNSVEENEMNSELGHPTIARLTIDHEVGSFKITLGDGRVVSLASGTTKIGVVIFPSEEAYQQQKVRYRKVRQLDSDVMENLADETIN